MAVWPLDVQYVGLNPRPDQQRTWVSPDGWDDGEPQLCKLQQSRQPAQSLISEQPSSTGPLAAASPFSAGGGDAAKIRFKVATSGRTNNSLNIRKVDMLEID
ncbi:uncharacterized protein ColSpa_09424 [Colletotrichum spaethianum]|uniref:Uncharacterized protein n=1 Tax=Colletotrichum spaethianum TaxID=700344 RepID=A0AA37PBM3_9PEZI|nr:uncharacterized protein ColSpa_09424 [Colletotrichum spaethianum]GKT49243.1 hypothetical protein ColSpa_09424 [Colletotrichum spaethianum]